MALTKVGSGVIQDDAVGIANLGATGTASSSTFLRGDNSWTAIASAGLDSMQFFEATGTWTKPADITKVIVFCTGGGGGSGGGDSHGGAGGGGATAIRFINSGLGATEAITIAAGGTAGSTGGGGSNGGAGGTSSFGSHCSSGGGGGSSGNTSGGGSSTTSGVVAGVDIAVSGSPGYDTAIGGGSFWGHGGSNQHLTANAYGSGGASSGPSSAVGKQGCIWIMEFK